MEDQQNWKQELQTTCKKSVKLLLCGYLLFLFKILKWDFLKDKVYRFTPVIPYTKTETELPCDEDQSE